MTIGMLLTRAPALSREEAALLPALAPAPPGNLLPPRRNLDFRQGAMDAPNAPPRQAARWGSMAGRAVLRQVGWGR